MNDLWLIWSNEHKAWWRPNSAGYTSNILKAGEYRTAQAVTICGDAFSPNDAIPPETMIPSCIKVCVMVAHDITLAAAD